MNIPVLNIIHLPERIDRRELLDRELITQSITNFKIWNGIRNQQAVFAGISAAHKQIVRYAKTVRDKKVMIAEDDIRFTCHGAFQYFLDNEPEDYDLYLASIYMGTLKEDNTVHDFSGLTLYMVHERFYDTFLGINPMNHLDRALAGKGLFCVCNPFAAVQWTTASDCKGGDIIDHTVWLRGRKLFNNGK